MSVNTDFAAKMVKSTSFKSCCYTWSVIYCQSTGSFRITYQASSDGRRMPDSVEVRDTRHEQMMGRQVCVAHQPAKVKLAVDAKDLMPCLCHLQVDGFLVLA